VHEALTRRDGIDAAPAALVAEHAREHARELGARFGGGYVGETLEHALATMVDEYVGFVAATARPRTEPGRSANDRLVAYERAGAAVAAALAEGARRRHFTDAFASALVVFERVVRPLVALTLVATTEYALGHYGDSLQAHAATLAHVADVLGPYCEAIVAPASETKLGVVQLLRTMAESR
jgi:hypothetical protein